MYKKGFVAILAVLPSELTTKEFPAGGGVALVPVVQYIYVEVLLINGQSIPSILTSTLVPKPLPIMCNTSPPILGANEGSISSTTEVEE